jgi:hypothetical protein
MLHIALSAARPGQRVARAIVSHAGVVLMQAGAELTGAIIDRLRSLGVDAIYVTDAGPETAKSLVERVREVEERFAGHEDDRWMMALKAIVLRQIEPDGAGDERS